jgi:hypothetical protein
MERRIATSDHAFASATLANVDRLFKSSARLRAPDGVTDGVFPTVRFWWSDANPAPIEVEVHQDCYELYRFFDGRTDILTFDAMGDRFPRELADLLSAALGQLPD